MIEWTLHGYTMTIELTVETVMRLVKKKSRNGIWWNYEQTGKELVEKLERSSKKKKKLESSWERGWETLVEDCWKLFVGSKEGTENELVEGTDKNFKGAAKGIERIFFLKIYSFTFQFLLSIFQVVS